MNSAQKVIQKFGGQSKLAEMIGRGQTTVQYWAKRGTIPSKWHGKILELASQCGVNIFPGDLIQANESAVELAPTIPEARWWGSLSIGAAELPCYVLDGGRRVISRTGATDILTEKKGGGNLESYIGVGVLKNYIPEDFSERMVEFAISGVVNKTVRGIEANDFIELCQAYVRALEDGVLQTDRQKEIAVKAAMFLAACAKVGLIALIDEATGYQYERAEDALRFKLRVYLEDEMRKWEKTFPEELWREFGRLTNWSGAVTQRPKYWGKLVMELICEYLDPDVADWLKNNAPKPKHGQNYHQWLSSQYGLKKLTEHIWMVIGMARACQTMRELRERMAEQYGREPYQISMFLPATTKINPRLVE